MSNKTATLPPSKATAKSSTGKTRSAVPVWAKLARSTFWMVIALVGMVAVTEALFAAAHIGEEEFVDIHPGIGFWHMPKKLVTWRSEGFSQSTTSSDGLRDIEYTTNKPAGFKRIAITGDSMVEGYQVAPDKTLAKLLEQRLNSEGIPCQVMNFGMSGFSTAQALYLYKEKIAKYHPDVVVVAYHIGDNEKNVYSPGADSFMPRPYCFLDGGGHLKTEWEGYDIWMNGQRHKSYDQLQWLRTNSRIWGVLTKCDLQLSDVPWYKKLKQTVTEPRGPKLTGQHRVTDTAADFGLPTEPFDVGYSKLPPFKGVYFPLPETLSSKEMKEASAARDYAVGWRAILSATHQRFAVTGSMIQLLNKACAKDKCKLVVAGLPALNNSMLYYRELQMMSKLAQREHFEFVDLNGAFPALAPMQPSNLYYLVHFTAQGHALAAQTIHDSIQRSGVRTEPHTKLQTRQ